MTDMLKFTQQLISRQSVTPDDAGCQELIAERLRKSIEDFPFEVDGKPVRITISLGIAAFPGDAEEKHELIEKADMALYQAKESGRNCFCCWDESFLSKR